MRFVSSNNLHKSTLIPQRPRLFTCLTNATCKCYISPATKLDGSLFGHEQDLGDLFCYQHTFAWLRTWSINKH